MFQVKFDQSEGDLFRYVLVRTFDYLIEQRNWRVERFLADDTPTEYDDRLQLRPHLAHEPVEFHGDRQVPLQAEFAGHEGIGGV